MTETLLKSCGAALLLASLLAPLQASADTLQGRVIGVTDGDTVTLLDASKTQHKIRLAGIDAPEKKQPFGQRSKESLSSLAYDQTLTIEWSKKDRYGRIVGKLVSKRGQDLNLEQIKRGMAWHYKKYENEQSPQDRDLYAAPEDHQRAPRSHHSLLGLPIARREEVRNETSGPH